jgi:outer membrane lipoprotein-sorting protein
LKPSNELYVNNGKEFWKYTEATRHAQKLPASSVELDFVDLVLRLDSLSQRYDVAPWVRQELPVAKKAGGELPAATSDDPPPAVNGMLLLALTPKQEGTQEKIFLRVDDRKAEVRELRIRYRNGNRTRIVFEALKEGGVEASRFDFTPPPGTAVDAIK